MERRRTKLGRGEPAQALTVRVQCAYMRVTLGSPLTQRAIAQRLLIGRFCGVLRSACMIPLTWHGLALADLHPSWLFISCT